MRQNTLRVMLLILLLGALKTNSALAISFDFGVSPSITVIAGQEVNLAAALINTDTVAVDFSAVPFGEGFDFFGNSGSVINTTFGNFPDNLSGVILAPNQRVDFLFGTFTVDASQPVGTILNIGASFAIGRSPDRVVLHHPIDITVGNTLSFAPITFISSAVPEPSSLVLFVCGLTLFAGWRIRGEHETI